MLLHSPIKNIPHTELGVHINVAAQPLPEYAEQRANVSIYFSMLLCLHYGRRDLLPLVWAWHRASIESHFATYNPADDDPDSEALSGPTSARFAVAAAERMLDIVLDYKLHVQVPVTVHEDELQNMAVLLNAVASKGGARCKDYMEAECGDAFGWLASEVGVGIKPIALASFINQRSGLASLVALMCQQAANEYAKTNSNMGIVNQCLDQARMAMVRMLGGQDFIHYPQLLMEGIVAMKGKGDMGTVWECLTAALYPRRGTVVCPQVRAFETDEECRDYRWRNGKVAQDIVDRRELCHYQTVPHAAKRVAAQLGRAGMDTLVRTFFEFGIAKATETLGLDEWHPVTFMRPKSYDAFMEAGRTKDFWTMRREGRESWHSMFSDDPSMARAVTDLRLWGEQGSPLTYCAFVRLDDYAQLAALGRMYGTKAVVWDMEAMHTYGTLTINDSQAAPFALPGTPENILKAMVPMMVGAYGEANGQRLCLHNPGPVPAMCNQLFGVATWPNFIEVQLHASMTPLDAVRVFDVDVTTVSD